MFGQFSLFVGILRLRCFGGELGVYFLHAFTATSEYLLVAFLAKLFFEDCRDVCDFFELLGELLMVAATLKTASSKDEL